MNCQSAKLVEVKRGTLTESLHRGRISIVDPRGTELFSLGNTNEYTYIRSAAKPFQLLPLVQEKLDERFNLTAAELAVMASSHSGEPVHLETVRSILKKIALDESYLRCGSHYPLDQEYSDQLKLQRVEPSPIHNNCSGKHAAMLTMAVAGDYSLHDYYLPDHPVQKLILKNLSELIELSTEKITLATDGCGVPVFSLPHVYMALLYARLANPSYLKKEKAEALRKISEAMRKNPVMVGGSNGRPCTDLMRKFADKLVAKWGWEGLFGIGILPSVLREYPDGIGIAVKIEDGNSARTLGPVAIELLIQLGILSTDSLENLSIYYKPKLYNHRKEIVGEITASFNLKQ